MIALFLFPDFQIHVMESHGKVPSTQNFKSQGLLGLKIVF